MTTEPKDVRGGDEAAEQRSAPSPSDPPPVREAVAWATCQACGGSIEGWICQGCGREFRENDDGNLVVDADPLPVSREAILRILEENIDAELAGTREDRAEPVGLSEAADKIILALTGETSRE